MTVAVQVPCVSTLIPNALPIGNLLSSIIPDYMVEMGMRYTSDIYTLNLKTLTQIIFNSKHIA